ncbi:dephospho-CoA kinase domain-containing protein-like [Mya arenaria]|uniref:dephospho-CoA kinase domain-containing protein-like n=1 Tax=Mya arenaria TaxID=6604 RepID=UPI0022E97236|nr:dephospho-CoA kinase domain-containing protein-like [Mya arenaria]
MFLVGLTGGIASGKSTVSNMFSELGVPIVDADLIAREVVEPGTPALAKIIAKFGREVLQSDGTLDREKLGAIIFADSTMRKELNRITHPEIGKAMMWKVARLFIQGNQFVILDLPLLFETRNLLSYLSYTIVVSCSAGQQLSRLQARDNYPEKEAKQRINAQMPLDEKCLLATVVIDNSNSIKETREQVLSVYQQFKSSRKHWKFRLAILAMIGVLSYSVLYFLW